MTLLRQLGMRGEHRLAVLRNQVTSLIKHGAITTTLPKAKELRRVADWMVTWAKKGYCPPKGEAIEAPAGQTFVSTHEVGKWNDKGRGFAHVKYRRLIEPWIKDKDALEDLLKEMPIRFAVRRGGYTRVMRVGFRKGDAAEMARIEWMEWDNEEDRAKFEALRKEREAEKTKVRKQVQRTLAEHKHGKEGMQSVRTVARMMAKAYYTRDLNALKTLGSRLQSRVAKEDHAKKIAEKEGRPVVPLRPPLTISSTRVVTGLIKSAKLPASFKLLKQKFNPANKYGGRGILTPKQLDQKLKNKQSAK